MNPAQDCPNATSTNNGIKDRKKEIAMTEQNRTDAFGQTKSGEQNTGSMSESVRQTAGEAVNTATTLVKDTAGEVAEQAKQTIDEATRQTKSELSNMTNQVRQQADSMVTEQKDMAAQRLSTLASTLRQTSQQLQDQDEATMGRYAEVIADQIDSVSDFLRQRNPNDLLGDIQRLARRQPEWFVAGSLAVGFLVGRFIKGPSRAASRESQYNPTYYGQSSYPRVYQSGGYQSSGYQSGGYQSERFPSEVYQGRYESSGFQGNAFQQGGQESSGYQAEGAEPDATSAHSSTNYEEAYEGGRSAYETGPTITEGSDTDYPRYDPKYAGGSSASEDTNYTPTSRR